MSLLEYIVITINFLDGFLKIHCFCGVGVVSSFGLEN